MNSSPNSRHRTSDLWEAAFLWAQGHPLSHTEHDDEGRVYFCFPDGGVKLHDQVQSYRVGSALVNPIAHRQGYYEMRGAMSRELADAGSR